MLGAYRVGHRCGRGEATGHSRRGGESGRLCRTCGGLLTPGELVVVMSREKRGSPLGTRTGSVERIHVAPATGGDPEPRESVEAVAGRGIEGDRYFRGEGIYNEAEDLEPSDITLIEAEAIAAAAADYGVEFESGGHRRNVTTRGVALNHLVGERFRVGEAILEGTGLCEPCGYMESLAGESDAAAALEHRGGLDARIVESGRIRLGDDVVW